MAHLIDTHAHLGFPEFKGIIEEIMSEASSCNVSNIINIALGKNSREINLCIDSFENVPRVFHSAGVHPSQAHLWDTSDLADFKRIFIERDSTKKARSDLSRQ